MIDNVYIVVYNTKKNTLLGLFRNRPNLSDIGRARTAQKIPCKEELTVPSLNKNNVIMDN